MTKLSSDLWRAFRRPRTFLPQEHGGWFLFLTPLAVGLLVARQMNDRGLGFALAALAVFLARQPLDLAIRSLSGTRTRADLPAVLAWLAIYGGLVAGVGGYLLFVQKLWGLIPLAAAGAGLLALQLWAGSTRKARTIWAEVIGTAGLALSAAGGHYAATGAGSPTALALWLLLAGEGVGGVLTRAGDCDDGATRCAPLHSAVKRRAQRMVHRQCPWPRRASR